MRIRNKARTLFAKQEFTELIDLERISIIQSCLSKAGAGCWFAWRPDELVMLLGHLPHWGASVCIYPFEGTPTLFVPALEPKETLPHGAEIVEYGWGLMSCKDPFAALRDLIETHLRKEKLDMLPITYVRSNANGSPSTSPAESPPFDPQAQNLFDNLGTSSLSLDAQLLDLYTVKTEQEIERIRLANRVADQGLAVFFMNLHEGRREAEIAGDVERAIQGCIGDDGVRYARAWAHIQSGPNSAEAGRFNRSSGRRLVAGDLVIIELATCVNGYWSDLTRTGCVGSPITEADRIWSVVAEAQALACKIVRPGMHAGEIDLAARSVIEDAGYGELFTHATGHHTGFRYHDPGPVLRPDAEEVITDGMIVTVEPGIYDIKSGIGCRIEDNLCVTPDGSDILSSNARDLFGGSHE